MKTRLAILMLSVSTLAYADKWEYAKWTLIHDDNVKKGKPAIR